MTCSPQSPSGPLTWRPSRAWCGLGSVRSRLLRICPLTCAIEFDKRILTLSGCEIGQLSVRHMDRLPTLDCGSGFTTIAASEYRATPSGTAKHTLLYDLLRLTLCLLPYISPVFLPSPCDSLVVAQISYPPTRRFLCACRSRRGTCGRRDNRAIA